MAQSAQGAAFALREQSAAGQGSSFAGIGASSEALSAFFFNPASITNHEGLNFEGNLAVVLPFTDATTTADPLTAAGVTGATGFPLAALPTTDNIGKEALVPASYATYQFNEKIWFGLAVNAPFGLGTRADQGRLESLSSAEFSAITVNIQPTIAYKFNERFSIAVGAQAQYIEVEQSVNTLTGGANELNATGWSGGVILGATFKPTDSTTIGLGYRSQQTVDLEGDLTLIQPSAAAGGLPFNPVVDAQAELALPDIVNLSLRQEIGDKFALLGTFSWENWSRLQEVDVVSAGLSASTGVPFPAAQFDFNYEDSFFFSVGGEYDASEHLTLRAGIAYETSPTNDEDRSLALPDNNRLWVSTGGTFRLNDHMGADFGFTWIRVEGDTPVNNNFQAADTISGAALGALGGAEIASGTADSNVFIFSVASRIKF
ncbi:MAG: outer membrane protein transport protein [Pseudomonadota bacterium]